MSEHFTRSTVSAAAWCNRCRKQTQHRVDDRRLGPCLECMFRAKAARGGIATRDKDGELAVKCHDATFDYLCARIAGNVAPYTAPVICHCPQREYPHDLSVHAEIRSEWFPYRHAPAWPWSLMLSQREEPSTERSRRGV